MAAEERRRAEEQQRIEIVEFRRKYAEEQATERREKIAAIRAEAQSRGACVQCALKDAPDRTPKYIKHRTRCPLDR